MSFVKHFYLPFALIMTLSATDSSANNIDSIKTDKDVFTFVKVFFTDRKSNGKFDEYYNDAVKVADSLKTKHWFKADIDNNGETDLLVFRANGLPEIFAILSINGTYKKVVANYWCKYQFIYPVITNIEGQDIVLLYSQDQINYDPVLKKFIYTKLECDTITLMNNRFINYVKSSRHYDIEKIEINNDGICEERCPRIKISINPKKLSSSCLKQQDWDNSVKNYIGQLTKIEIKNILALLQYSNFGDLRNIYKVRCSDQTTTTLTVVFNGGKTKKIEDYGSSGNFTLSEIYNIAFNTKWMEVKEKRTKFFE